MNSDDYELRFDGNLQGRNKAFHAFAGLAPLIVGNRSQSEIAVTNVTFGARQFDVCIHPANPIFHLRLRVLTFSPNDSQFERNQQGEAPCPTVP